MAQRVFTNQERLEFILEFTRMSHRGVATDAGDAMGLNARESWALFTDPQVQAALQSTDPSTYDFDKPAGVVDATMLSS